MKKIVFATVLIVEDSTVTRKTVMEGLKNFNLGFLESATGQAALVIAQNAQPDVILLDLNLPDMHGYDVLQEIRKHPSTARIPVIVITQSNLTQDVQKCLKGGAQYYQIKPLDMGKLLAAVCKLLEVTEEELSVNILHRERIMEDIKRKLEFGPKENTSSSTYIKMEVKDLRPGMSVGIPVVLPGGRVLMNPETILNEDRIQDLQKNEVKYVYVKPLM